MDFKKDLYACPKCYKIFSSQTGYFYHINKVECDKEQEDTYKCPKCFKILKRNSISYHSKIDCVKNLVFKEYGLYHCKDCDKSFKTKISYSNHKCRVVKINIGTIVMNFD